MPGTTLNRRVIHETFTIAAGVTAAAPFTLNVDLAASVIEEVFLVVPPGPSGFMGVSMRFSGGTLLPFGGSSDFLIFDNVQRTFPLDDFEVSTPVQLVGYNTDVYDHSTEWHFTVRDISRAAVIGTRALVLNG